jgi:hypothetical protein
MTIIHICGIQDGDKMVRLWIVAGLWIDRQAFIDISGGYSQVD